MAAPQPLRLPTDPGLRETRAREARLGRLRYGAILAALLVHAAVIAALLAPWPFAFTPPAPEPPPISVALVIEAPPPPAPKPAATQPAPAPRPALHELVSGPDQETTAPPQAADKGAEAAPKPQPQLEPQQAEAPVAVPPKPKPSELAKPQIKEASRETAPKPLKEGSVDRVIGERNREGDPYLNQVYAMIERHRFYPAGAIGSLGLNLEGTAVYLILLSPAGAIEGIRLERSAGAPQLDEAARKMIEQAAPFPPLPNYFPRAGVVLSVTLPIFPTAS